MNECEEEEDEDDDAHTHAHMHRAHNHSGTRFSVPTYTHDHSPARAGQDPPSLAHRHPLRHTRTNLQRKGHKKPGAAMQRRRAAADPQTPTPTSRQARTRT
eukprot:GHVU01000126.1.p1 GENE.GHVU01000126.1~~GHVU01000126.1.p1  ORF type:complete len:101 (-),score=9.78 GHVU01000126.1:4-306(-)